MLQRAAPSFICLHIDGKDIQKWWHNLPAIARSPKGKAVDPSDPLVAAIDVGLIVCNQIIQAVRTGCSIDKVLDLKFDQDQLNRLLTLFKVSMAKERPHWVVSLNHTNYKLPNDFDLYGKLH